jgi:hypothetical protein
MAKRPLMNKILQEQRPSKNCNCDDLVGLDVLCRSSYATTAKGLHQRSAVPRDPAATIDPGNYLHTFMLHLFTTDTVPSKAHGKSGKVS